MLPDVVVFPYTPIYRQQVLDLSRRAWTPVFAALEPTVPSFVFQSFYPRGWAERQSADLAEFLELQPDDVWLAQSRGRLAGWVGLRARPEDRMGELYVLAVDPAFQRQGVGQALVDHAIATMRAAGFAMLMVETGDDPGHSDARALYERNAFERWPVARYFRPL